MSASRPNVVFIVGDNVGWGDIGCYGGLAPTLRIDALAGEGARFKNYNVEAQCTPTRSALLTGRLPHTHRQLQRAATRAGATRMQEQFELAGLTKTIGSQHFYPTVRAAVEGFARSEGGSGVSTGARPDAN